MRKFAIRNFSRGIWPAGSAIALGFLTKGPVALAIPLVALAAAGYLPAAIFFAGENFSWRFARRFCAVFASGRAVVSGGFSARAALGALHDFGPGRRPFARHHHQKPPRRAVLLLRNSCRRPFAVDVFARLAVAARALAGTGRPSESRLAAAECLGHFPLRLVLLVAREIARLHFAGFSGAGGDAGLEFFGGEVPDENIPAITRQSVLAGSLLLPATFPFVLSFAFPDTRPEILKWQAPLVAGIFVLILWATRKWKWSAAAALAVALALAGFFVTLVEARLFQTDFRRNQTLQPLAIALRENYRPGDAVVCWGRFPQGLPFYAAPAISAANRPYLGDMELTEVPFEFPGNRERLGDFLLPDDDALARMLERRPARLGGRARRHDGKFSEGPRRGAVAFRRPCRPVGIVRQSLIAVARLFC